MIVSKTTVSWLYGILEVIGQERRKALVNRIGEACDFLRKNAKQAHPERDRQLGKLLNILEPVFYAGIN